MHVHVYSGDGEAKFWLEPKVSLARKYGLSEKQVSKLQKVVEDRQNEIEAIWRRHFRN